MADAVHIKSIPAVTEPHTVLNQDILTGLVDYVERIEDMLNLMKTCKLLYNAGRLKLRQYILRFEGNASYSKFQAFMAKIRKNPSEIEQIRRLSIDIPKERKKVVGRIVLDVIRGGINLESLKVSVPAPVVNYEIDGGANPIVPRIRLPHIPSVSRSHLQHLTVRNLDDYALRILQCTNAPLKSVNIAFIPLYMRPDGVRPIIYTLSKFAATLEELQVSDETWPHSVIIPIQFPRLHTLVLTRTYLSALHVLIYAFPNLKNFVCPFDAHAQMLKESIRNPHAVYMKQLQDSARMWNLDSLHISSHALYCFSLECPVKYLDLQSHAGYMNPFDQTQFGIWVTRTIVDRIQPPKLRLTLSKAMLNSILQHKAPGFYEVLSYPTLTHFSLDVPVQLKFVDIMLSFIDEFIKALQSNNTIQTICLTLHRELCDKRYLHKGDQARFDPTYDAEMDRPGFATKFAAAVGPSVQNVIFTSVAFQKSPRKKTTRVDGWRVVRGVDDSVGLEVLTQSDCGRIISGQDI